MMISPIKVLSLYTVAMLLSSQLTSWHEVQIEQGRLHGFVSRKWTGEPLSGVKVQLIGTNLDTVSDWDGKFQLHHIPVATYALRFSFPGFDTLTLNSVSSLSDDTVTAQLQCTRCKGVRERAILDTTNATLVHMVTGGLANPDSAERERFASITRRYGYETWYGGCDQSCSEEYNMIINQWLDKHNGKNWRQELSTEFQILYKKMH